MIETLVVIAITGCLASGSGLDCRFPTPPDLARRQVRLALACPQTVRLNGSTVEGGARVRTVSDLLNTRGENKLQMGSHCAPAKLLVTPRVYLSGIRAEGSGLAVTIENSLDNTVSIGLACHGPAGSGTASATIPANGQTELSVAVRATGRVSCVLEKTPEAVEESYTFQMEAIFQ